MPIFFSRALKVASLRFTAEKSSSTEVVLTVISSATTNLGGQVREKPENTAQLEPMDTTRRESQTNDRELQKLPAKCSCARKVREAAVSRFGVRAEVLAHSCAHRLQG